MVLDLTNPAHLVRLKVGDIGDLPLLPDDVYDYALTSNNSSLARAAQDCAGYILAILSQKTHKKLSQLEVWDNTQFDNYLRFIKEVIKNPMMNGIAPLPYVAGATANNDIKQFLDNWKGIYSGLTESEYLAYFTSTPSN